MLIIARQTTIDFTLQRKYVNENRILKLKHYT